MSCGCNSGTENTFITQLDLDSLNNLKSVAQEKTPTDFSTQKLWIVGSQPVIATGTADGKRGCVTLPYLGIPVKLCWEIKEFDPIPPEVSVKTRITVSVKDVEYFSAILVVKCENITNLSTCEVSLENDYALEAAFKPKCNWSCLRKCAPGCITCGSDYWCWAGCAGSCILKCCSL
ncbi:hypothetical protein FYZ48_04095 [Gimesia chilikensis]|uniref:hypothetical protein n=1 Tax=Gimesia chilikensis TaxID=2605989 RepID=UPI0011ED846F|nr:hypothetical protein [Gimesia chilikensis]KAA0141566.1 hypothetical protein FYZ48_04095 [Gimesia chilikensis]